MFRGFEGDEENENLETGYDAFKHRVIGLEEGTEGRWALDLGAIQPSPDAPVVTRLMLDRGTLRVSRLGVGADGMEADITWGTETPRPRASRLEWVLEVEEGQEVANAEFSYVSFGDIRWESIKLPSTGTVDLLIMNECGCEYYAGGDENEENETGWQRRRGERDQRRLRMSRAFTGSISLHIGAGQSKRRPAAFLPSPRGYRRMIHIAPL